MDRDGQADTLRYSDVWPDRFEFETYVSPESGEDRDVDHVPEAPGRALPVFANRGYQHLKGR